MEFSGYLMSGEQPAARIEKNCVEPLDRSRMPLYLVSGGDFETWLVGRAIDRHRPNSRILKKVLRLTDSSDTAAVLRAHAATITDCFWVKSGDEPNLSYEQIRFREDTFAEIALTGSFSSYSREYELERTGGRSPELTNTGSFEKCWRLEEEGWWLYKSGNPLERFSELFIAKLGKAMGFAMAEYLPDGQYVKTRDFTGGRLNFEPAEALVGEEEDYGFNYERLTALRPELGRQYLDILYLDALCFNMDRHTQNYGLLRDQHTGEILRMAPNFDNNIALISRGYGPDARQTNGLLMEFFLELLEEKGLTYESPALNEETVRILAENTLPEEDINRTYVAEMVMERWQRMERRLHPTQEQAGQRFPAL